MDRKFEDYTPAEIKRIDKALAKKMQEGKTISDSEKSAFLAKAERRNQSKEEWKETGRELAVRTADKLVDRVLDKSIRINSGQNQIEIGADTSSNQPPPTRKIPLGVWLAIGLVALILLIFLLVKFAPKGK